MDGRKRKRFLSAVKWNRVLEQRPVPRCYRADREIVLAAVRQNGYMLQFAAEECKADREIVLAAVQQTGCEDGSVLQFAAEECKADHAIVLAAVKHNGMALEMAAEECKADCEIVWAAVQQNPDALQDAADELLLDSTFASKAKQEWYILKVSMLSARSTVVMGEGDDCAEFI
eukprot:2185863-Amphidinium_carterae.1